MREVAFIKKNKDKWLSYEEAISGKVRINPDELAGLYIQLINDLSFAQTYYPKSKVTAYLNHLAATTYHKIYKTQKFSRRTLIYLFRDEVPALVRTHFNYLIIAFAVFGLFVLIGVLSANYDDTFIRAILGNDYVEMTIRNIEQGNPVAVYKSGSDWGSFIGITINNLRVGIYCFTLGITGGAGTLYIAMQNGIMLGAFQTMFVQYGVFWESIRGIWIHGSMEIFAIVIEIMAGLILGGSILFPGNYTRLDSFKRGIKTSTKIWLSTLPFTIAAGFLEGFISRFALEMPAMISMAIILSTLSLIAWYYLVYPFSKPLKISDL